MVCHLEILPLLLVVCSITTEKKKLSIYRKVISSGAYLENALLWIGAAR